MAQQFLDRLPRVPKEELSENDTCIICQDNFGTTRSDTEPAEEAVRLPCPGGHIVGFKCISTWFLGDTDRDSCPCCRHKFVGLASPVQVTVRQLSIYRAQALERWRNQRQEFRSFLLSAGATPDVLRKWDLWFSLWNSVANGAEGYGLLRSGLQTLYFREYYHYKLRLLRNDFTAEILRGPKDQLSFSDKAAIYSYLRRTGAFRGYFQEVESDAERWGVFRSLGCVFNEERHTWVVSSY